MGKSPMPVGFRRRLSLMTLSSNFMLYSDVFFHPPWSSARAISCRSSPIISGFWHRSVNTWLTSSVVVWMAAKEKVSCTTAAS